MNRMITFCINFLSRPEFKSRMTRPGVRILLLVLYTWRGMSGHHTGVRCAALTFYTLISIVPILAVIFAVVKGFGMLEPLIESLYGLLPHQPEFVDYVVDFANRALANTHSGVVAAVGIAMLFVSVAGVFNSIENAFNHIWEVKSSRSISKYPVYITIVVVLPLLWAGVSGISTLFVDAFRIDSQTLGWLSKAVSLVAVWLAFALLYYTIPNTSVRFSKALVAALVAGTAFLAFQWGYVYLQKMMTSYNAIYGSFAALPLFLLWVRYSWTILLFGAEFSFAYQNMDRFTEESEYMRIDFDSRCKIAVAAMTFVVWRFADGRGAVRISEIKRTLDLPTRIVNSVVGMLVDARQLVELPPREKTEEACYLPARDSGSFTVFSVMESLTKVGTKRLGELDVNELIACSASEWERLKEFSRTSADNRTLMTLARENERLFLEGEVAE